MSDDELRKRIDDMSCTIPGDPHPWKFEDLVAELVKATRTMDEAMQGYCKHPGVVETDTLFAAHRGLQAALKPFEGS